jgi:hypothetical protein
MSSKDALDFLDRILKNFPPYNWTEDRQKEWVTSVVKELGQMPRDVLMRAADELVRTRKVARTPVVAELVDACKEAQYWVERDKAGGQLNLDSREVKTFAIWSDERRILADQLVMTPQGKRAAKEGWIFGLHNFIRENGRVPTEYEERQLKQSSEEFLVEFRKCLNGGFACAKPLAELGAKMLKRREELSDMVLHGVVR